MGFVKKCLGVFLALALCLTVVPGAYAEESDQAGANQAAESVAGEDVSAEDSSSAVVPEPDEEEPDQAAENAAEESVPTEEPGSAVVQETDRELTVDGEPKEDPSEAVPEPAPFYSDVAEDQWSYAYIRALFDLGILSPSDKFYPGNGCTRLDFVNMLYKCDLVLYGEPEEGWGTDPRFTDVLPGSEGYDAVMWAAANGVAAGINDTEFGGDGVLLRQESAAFVIRMARSCNIPLPKARDMVMFRDAASISAYARSAVTACQMAKLLSGKGDGVFDPRGTLTREEAATLVYQLYNAASREPVSGEETVSTEPGAYLDEFMPQLFFINVPESLWSYRFIKTLYDMGMYEGVEVFDPGASTSRLEFVKLLYELHLALGGAENQRTSSSFTDIPAGSSGFDAVMWAVDCGVTSGIGDGQFGPTLPLTREQCAEFLVRTARVDGIFLVKKKDALLFTDAASISKYARSSVTACQMAGVINGYDDKKFRPRGFTSCQEAATVVCKFLEAARNELPEGTELVSTEKNAYLSLYDGVDYVFGTPVPASDPVPASWFDNAVFIGDSVSVGLESYQNSTKALGNATMLCSVSFNAINALLPVSSTSLHPQYHGVKRLLEDNVKACGAKNVYIMLGMNGLTYPFDYTMERTERMIDNILNKNPGVNIIIQSVTPMTNNSYLTAKYGYTNAKINQFNERLKQLCAKRKWYYIDVASAMKDSSGALRTDFCADNYDMGIHVTNKACAAWVEYLKTHVPANLHP